MAGVALSLCLTVVGGDYINGLLWVGEGGGLKCWPHEQTELENSGNFLKHGTPKHTAHTLWKYAYKLSENKRGDRLHATLNTKAL